MNWNIVEGTWKEFQGNVKEYWGKLNDSEIDAIAGKRIHLAGKIQETYGVNLDEAERQIKIFEERHKHYRPNN